MAYFWHFASIIIFLIPGLPAGGLLFYLYRSLPNDKDDQDGSKTENQEEMMTSIQSGNSKNTKTAAVPQKVSVDKPQNKSEITTKTDKDGCSNKVAWGLTGTFWLMAFIGLFSTFVALFFVFFYWLFLFFFWMEAYWYSSTYKYLKNFKEKPQDMKTIIDNFKNTDVNIVFRAECYHYETRYDTVWYTDANGNRMSRLESYQEKVVSHRDTEFFSYTSCTDKTKPYEYANNEIQSLVKLKMYQQIIWADDESSIKFNIAFNDFKKKNKFDTYQSYWSDFSFGSDWKDKYLTTTTKDVEIPELLKLGWFWIYTFAAVGPLYRMWLDRVIVHAEYEIVKLIKA